MTGRERKRHRPKERNTHTHSQRIFSQSDVICRRSNYAFSNDLCAEFFSLMMSKAIR